MLPGRSGQISLVARFGIYLSIPGRVNRSEGKDGEGAVKEIRMASAIPRRL